MGVFANLVCFFLFPFSFFLFPFSSLRKEKKRKEEEEKKLSIKQFINVSLIPALKESCASKYLEADSALALEVFQAQGALKV